MKCIQHDKIIVTTIVGMPMLNFRVQRSLFFSHCILLGKNGIEGECFDRQAISSHTNNRY